MQDLKNIITTTAKFKESLHTLYIMKDQENKTVVGILKVGIKKLFVMVRLNLLSLFFKFLFSKIY